MDPKQPRIADGTIGNVGNAAWISTRCLNLIAQCRRDCGFLSVSGMEAGNDGQFHQVTERVCAASYENAGGLAAPIAHASSTQ